MVRVSAVSGSELSPNFGGTSPASVGPNHGCVPDGPDAGVDAAVREYVADYECAFNYRAMAGYGEELVEFNLNASVAVTERGPDWVVAASDYAMDHGRWADGDGTPHGYFDGHRYAFGYLVTSKGVWRAAHRETGTVPNPRIEGELLACF